MTEYTTPRFADDGETASALEFAFNQDALRNTLARIRRGVDPSFDGLHCIDCESSIPKDRLDLGKDRCVPCQELIDRDLRRRR